MDNRSSTEIPTSSAASISAASSSATPTISGRARGASLTSRFPGDQSHRPLDIIKQQTRIADRAPHLRRKHIVGSDSIDRLDVVGGRYHHDGPYDATLLARNTSSIISPVEAVAGTNKEALKATPKEKIIDSIQRHRPLDDVAIVPPGITDGTGHTFDYEEGADLMIEEGNYRRWPGVVCHSHHSQSTLTTNKPRSNIPPTTSKAKASLPSRSRKPSKHTKTTAAFSPTATPASK